jgi:hypothetical protein
MAVAGETHLRQEAAEEAGSNATFQCFEVSILQCFILQCFR